VGNKLAFVSHALRLPRRFNNRERSRRRFEAIFQFCNARLKMAALLFELLLDLGFGPLAVLREHLAHGRVVHPELSVALAAEIESKPLADPMIDLGHPTFRPLVLLGFARLLRFLFGLLLGSQTINRIARMREIVLGQLLPNSVGVCVGALTLLPLFE
jgi:hypothetical protein